jgi:hypothetical protein
MITFTFRLRKKVLAATALLLVVGMGFMGFRAWGERGVQANRPGAENPQTVKAVKAKAKTNEERVEFIESYGWEVTPEPLQVIEVVIPKEFDDVYTAYNDMQQSQGFDLRKYAGKRCTQYSYAITNYPEAEEAVQIHLLMNGSRIVGGNVSSTLVGGFMHGLLFTGSTQQGADSAQAS